MATEWTDVDDSPASALRTALEEAAHLLPMQGPIHTFVHHNTLHAFQHLPFHAALAEAARRFETESYLPEATFREAFARGRIRERDLVESYDAWAVAREPGDQSEPGVLRGQAHVTRRVVHLAMLHQDVDLDPSAAQLVDWHLTEGIREGGAAVRARADQERARFVHLEGLLAELSDGELGVSLEVPPRRRTHRELLRDQTGDDPALLVNSLLVRWCGAYLDQGTAQWPLAGRSEGFYEAFRRLMTLRRAPAPSWARELGERLRNLPKVSAEAAALRALDDLGVRQEDYGWYVERVLLELPGWAGMIRRLETHPEELAGTPIAPRLLDYLAVRLTLTPLAIRSVAEQKLEFRGHLRELFDSSLASARRIRRPDADRVQAFRLLRLLPGVSCNLAELTADDARAMLGWMSEFPSPVRRQVWHEAYERFHRDEVLDGLLANARRAEKRELPAPRFQVAFCIDDREESFRRHLEETASDVQTLGVAGFFGLAVEWRGLDEARYAASCPVAVRPAHRVVELPRPGDEVHAARRRRRRAVWGACERWLHHSTRSWGAVVWAPALGALAGVPLLLQVLFPRLTARWGHRLKAALLPRPETTLTALRDEADTQEAERPHGFTAEESVARIAGTLENLGLVRAFAPLVVLLGHGAESRNNPHGSAYECGACGGRQGGPNARLFAHLANDPRVRSGLAARGIHVPEDTWFVGGQHDTTSDGIELYDVARLPASHRAVCDELRQKLDIARARNAHERCRRFESAPRGADPLAALRHVEMRARALDEPRPELGHATNAVCVVGRRALTRGLFLDRRAFLVEYEPTLDADGGILERILAAVAPVGAGINLEYYFSRVDNDRFGCGSKLAHNPMAGLGVMDGAESDLRTGLPWQMVELHEPVRLLLVVESTPERILEIASRQPEVAELVTHGWIRSCCLQLTEAGAEVQVFDPERGFSKYEASERDVPHAPDSVAWYLGQGGFVSPALIEKGRGVPLRDRDAVRSARSRGAAHVSL